MARRDEVVTRLAEVSHATWMLQSVRDVGRTLDGLFVGDPIPPVARDDVVEAERRLAAVRDDGVSLSELSSSPAHQVMPHDVERAEQAVRALEALGLSFD